MYYAPHILQKKTVTGETTDDNGHVVAGTEQWVNVCRCRCDDNSTEYFTSDNGQVYRPDYHIVAERTDAVSAGDEIRCLDGETTRGEGKAYMVKSANYFNYTEVWI